MPRAESATLRHFLRGVWCIAQTLHSQATSSSPADHRAVPDSISTNA
jgi:hypothetical protein